MCCAGFFPSDFSFSKHHLLHLLAQYAGASSCTVRKGSRYHVSLCATMRGVSMHLCHPQDEGKRVSMCERCLIPQYGSISTCMHQRRDSCLLTVNIVVSQPVRTSSCSAINGRERMQITSSPRAGATGYATVRCYKVPDHSIEEYMVLLMSLTEEDGEGVVREFVARWITSSHQHVLGVYMRYFRSRQCKL